MSDNETIDLLVERVAKIKCHACHEDVDVSRALPFSTIKCPHCSADLPVPAILGNFILVKEIGKGAMGSVYMAFDKTLKRHVAIKVVLSSLGDDPVFVDNFIREAQALAALNHVNVVQIYSCGTEKGQPYIVMELIEGRRLDDIMGDSGGDEQYLLGIALDVINGLKAAHEIGLIHGDIKPQNILVDQRDTAKVVDFGLARNADNEEVSAEIWGTPYYIAPEKARRQKEDHRSDIYCLGATLFHAFTGQPPFDGETARDVVMKRLKEKAPNMQEIRPELNDKTAYLISRMLEAEPSRRYPTYDSLLSDLHLAILEAKKGPRVVEDPKPSIGLWVKVALSLLLLAALGGGAFYFLNQGKKEEPPPGRYVTKFINGEMVRVFVPDVPDAQTKEGDEPPDGEDVEIPPGYNLVKIPVTDGVGADVTIHAQEPRTNFGNTPTLQASGLEPFKKIYLRFDLTPVNLFKSIRPSLTLTFAEDFRGEETPAKLILWALKELPTMPEWKEGTGGVVSSFSGPITWKNAVGNNVNSGSQPDSKSGVLLLRKAIDQSYAAGESITLTVPPDDETFLKFLQDDANKQVTLIVTQAAKEGTPPFVFGSKESDAEPVRLNLFTR